MFLGTKVNDVLFLCVCALFMNLWFVARDQLNLLFSWGTVL